MTNNNNTLSATIINMIDNRSLDALLAIKASVTPDPVQVGTDEEGFPIWVWPED